MRFIISAVLLYQIIGGECRQFNDKPVGPYETMMTQRRFISGCNEFNYELLKQFEYNSENIIFSPLSICTALGMLVEGARNETKIEILKALHWNKYWNHDYIRNHFRSIFDEYKHMNTRSDSPRNATIEVANMALTSNKSPVNKVYTDILKEDYEALVGEEDFGANGNAIKEKVNNFVKEKTHSLIDKILDAPLNPSTALFLANTVYFKGFWENTFPSSNTHKGKFYNHDNSDKLVDMMQTTAHFRHHFDNKYNVTLLELPYKGEVSLIILLPHERHGLQKALENISFDEMNSLIEKMDESSVEVHFPKFKYEFKNSLSESLPKLGLPITFGDSSDFSGIAPGIKISEAVHKAVIETYEAGTKAAAVTAIFLPILPSPLNPKKSLIVCDHPFAFIIRDTKSGINLFAGALNEL